MTDEELNQRFGRLVDAQIRFQSQLGDLARIFRERIEVQDRVIQEIQAEVQTMQQRQTQIEERQAESDQRFQVLLDEMRFLIRQQYPPNIG